MKKLIFIFIFILIITSRVFTDYILEPANCTLKKQNHCWAYLYNNKKSVTYFYTLEKCKEIMPALEEYAVEETKGTKESKKSKIPKFKKKEKKKSKIPKFKKKSE